MASNINLKGQIAELYLLQGGENRPVAKLTLKPSREGYEALVSAAEAAGIVWQTSQAGNSFLPVGNMSIRKDGTLSYSIFRDSPAIAFVEEGDSFQLDGVFAAKGETVAFRNGEQEVRTTGFFVTRFGGEYVGRYQAALKAAKRQAAIQAVLAGNDTAATSSDVE